jgi:hypothetical protein
MSDDKTSFMNQFASARASVRETAKHSPHMFPAWQQLQAAKQLQRQANELVGEKQAAWENYLKEPK